MKQQQQQQARDMYTQSNLGKTEIAEKLGVSRRSVYQWSVEGDWEKLRTSARSMPSLLAEKCYYLINHFTDHLLSRDSFYQSVTKADVDILFKLTKTVSLLKKGSTINENMETFTRFLDTVTQTDPALAQSLIPHADAFITGRAAATVQPLSGFTDQGFKPFPEKEIMEKWQDEKDAEALAAEAKSQVQPDSEPQPSQSQDVQPPVASTEPVRDYEAPTATHNPAIPYPDTSSMTLEERKAFALKEYEEVMALRARRLPEAA